ncbi:MAG: cytidyltransferase [Nitrospirae bacterium]|nr:cytidyltransferase [Nitrospirota bacterium]
MTSKKILTLNDLIRKTREFKAQGNVVVQSHGVFDLIHPGTIAHLKSAKAQGDIFIVTVIKDKDIRRGPGRPVFSEALRAENVASLEIVDYVSIVDDEIPFECIKMLNPDVFAKGQPQKERDQLIHKRIFEQEKELYLGRVKIFETAGFSFSSSRIINDFLTIYPEETKVFLKKFSGKYDLSGISSELNKLKNLNVLLIGDGIIDEYHYCAPMNRSPKANIIVNKYLTHERFAGGAFAIANHIAGLCKQVHLVTLLGTDNSHEEFILENLKPNITSKFFYRDESPTIVKKRYINQFLNQKIFEINYLNDDYIEGPLAESAVSYLKSIIPDYDLVLISDFGHGLITKQIINTVSNSAKILAVNTQTNGANAGYNLITKYKNPNLVCLDEPELRLAAQDRTSDTETIARRIAQQVNANCFIVTLGRKGSLGISKQEGINRTPIFSSKVIDTVGAGDAFFSYVAPCYACELPLDLISFIGNAVGAMAVQIVCNKKSIEKHELLEFIHALLKQ